MKYSYKHISSIVNKDNFNNLYNSLPMLRKKKVDSLKNLKDKYLSIGAYILLMSMLPKGNYVYLEDQFGKPYFKGNPIYFSISHSGDYVAVAINETPVGIDIQINKNVNYDLISKKIMNDEEYQEYLSCKEKEKYFYKLFTFKEAYSKYIGQGLKLDFKLISSKENHTVYINNENFSLSVVY